MADSGSRRSGNNTQQLPDGQPSSRSKRERQQGWSRGPRSLFLRRCDNNGFGFTLRHFIVYPPESYTVLQGDRRLGLRHGNTGQGPGSAALDEPMDTIFVKNVRENSSADVAGLATGDRIISVNGETITGRTYAQVVQLIQKSGNFLHLLVVPKEDDILQLYFGETAHNPETNQRPSRVKSPETSAQHHRGTGQASMMRQQSPVPFSSLQPTLQQQQASSLPLPHHLRHHQRQQLTSQNPASSRPLLQNPPHVANLQGVKTATCPQTSRIAMPSAVDSSSLWSAQSVPSSGNETQARVMDRVTFYYGAGEEDANNGMSSNFHSHVKGPSVRRSSNGNSAALKMEGAYGCAGSGRCGGDLRAVGGGNESNLFYSVPGNERRMSLDNSVWSRDSTSSAMYKLGQSEDIMGSAGGGLAYPNSEGSRGLYCGQNLGSLAPMSDNSMPNSSCGSTENIHLATGGVNSLQRLHYSGAAGCRYSLDGGTSRRDSSVSLPANGLVRDGSSTTEGSKDSLVSFDSTSTLTGTGQDMCSSDDSIIISRIRKSFEQKEEFLKRPNQPISWNISSGNQQQPPSPLISHHAFIAREFYARPQKFQRPLWPPQNPSSSSPLLYRQQSPPRSASSGKSNFSSSSSSNTSNKPTHQILQRVKSDIDSERDSLSSHGSGEERPCNQQSTSDLWDNNQTTIRGEFIYGGPVSNVPTTVLTKSALSQHTSPQFRPVTPVLPSASPVTGNTSNGGTASLRHGGGGKPSFISTLTRIHENIPVSDPRALGETYTSVIIDATEEVIDASRGSSSLPSSLPSSPAMGAATADPGAQQPRSLLTTSEGNQNPSHVHPMLQLVSRRARQFETGRLDDEEGPPSDRTSLYRSELSRLSSKRSVPNVAVRKREFESRSTSATTGGGGKDGRRLNRESRSLENAGVAVTQLQKYGTPAMVSPLSGNRLIPIGSKHLHCEPPADFCQQRTDSPSSENQDATSEPVKLRQRSNSADSWAVAEGSASRLGAGLEWAPDTGDDRGDGAKEPQRHKAFRQESYLAAVRSPVTAENMAQWLKRQGALPMDEHEEMDGLTPPVPSPATVAIRPTQLPIVNPYRPAESQPVTSSPTCGVADGATTDAHDGIGKLLAALNGVSPVPVSAVSSDSSNVVRAASTDTSAVVRRQKKTTISEEERLVRRVSYLKATWGDRMHVDSDLDLSDTESTHIQLQSAHRRWRPPLFPDDIQRLKRIFEEAAASSQRPTPAHARQRQRRVIGTESSTAESLQPESNKENLLREGWLHCKITLVDGKRAGDRSWKQVWAVLRGPILYLYKDRRDSQQQQQQTPLNVSDTISESQTTSSAVDVRCSQVDIADNYTKKKHVLRLNTLGGSELLLQADDADNMVQWIHALQAQANEKEEYTTSGSSKQQQQSAQTPQSAGAVSGGANSRLSPLPTHKGIRKLTSFRNRSPTGQSPVNKTRKPSQTDQIPSPKTKTWKGRVARQFRRIQQGSGSPSSPTAPHPEGVTIGVPLEDCPQSTFSEFVPLLVELCTNIVELRGLDITGIYRVPGNTAVLSSLTEGVNKGFDSISLQDTRWNDVNVVSSLLKLFFRRLPDSLLTSELYPHFIEADKIEDPAKRVVAIKKLLHELPDHHFETLKFLLLHLKKVVEHCTANKMEARNLAIIFGPTLVRTADDNMVTMVTDMAHQCQIIELLISHVDWFFSDDESEDFSNFPFSLPQDSSEAEPASVNHNLLLSNIQKVEGMKADSPNKDISAKDIVSSIISAANRKMQKAKARKGGRGTGSGASVEDGRETSGEVKEIADNKQQTSEGKPTKRKESVSAAESDVTPASTVASSIFESVVFSGNIVKSIHTGEEDESAAERSEAGLVPNNTSAHEECGGGEAQVNGRSNKVESSDNAKERCQAWKRDGGIIGVTDEVPIRTYAGLSALTQERIRRFERETKAMLQRDLSRQRSEAEWREADRKRIEMELQQAKRDMESEDLLDRIADNPSDITKRITDISNVLQRDRKCAAGDSSKYASTIGRRFSSSSLLSSSTNSNSVTSSNSELPRSPLLASHSNCLSSSRDDEYNQTKFGSTQRPVDKNPSSPLQQFTQTKKVGTTNIFPDNLRRLGGVRNDTVDGCSSSSNDVAVSAQSRKPDIERASTELDGGASLPRSAMAVTLSPSTGCSQHVLRRGNSAENLHAAVQQHAQKGAAAPNGTLKKLKTGKEQLQLATPLVSPRPPSPLIGSLRCGSLDSLQEAYSSERPQSDISDDGSDLLVSLTSTFDRKLRSLLSTTTSTAEAVSDATTVTETTKEPSKLPQEKGTAENHDAKSLPVSAGESADTPESSQLETSAVKFSDVERVPIRPAAVFTSTCAALFRDPSLHRRVRTSVDHQEQKHDATGKDEELMETRKQDNIVQGRSGESGSLYNRSSYPLADQKSLCRGKNCEKRGEDDEACSGSSTTAPKDVTAVARHKSVESASKTEKTETSHKPGLGWSECMTKSEKDGGSAANVKLKRSESLTKADKQETSAVNTRLKRSESLTKAEKGGDSSLANTKLKRSESLTKAEKTEVSSNTRLRRSESLTKTERSESPSNSKLKRSDSLTKTEKTESNISKRRQQEMLISGTCVRSSSRGNKEKENITTFLTKLKRKNGMPERSIKRRHTVGGTKDFDKVHWLDNRLQHEQLAENEATDAVAMAMNNKERHCLRTSSPDLSSSRLSGVLARDGFLVEISLLGSGGVMAELRQHLLPVGGRPHSLPDPNLASRVFKVPLESHV